MMSTAAASLIAFQFAAGALAMAGPDTPSAAAPPQASTRAVTPQVSVRAAPQAGAEADVPANWADAPAARPALVAPVSPHAPAATSKVIREAVRDVIADDHAADREAPAVRRYATQAPPDRFQAFAEQFDDARVPDCLHSEGLKRQPTSIGPFGVAGLLALPFVAVAKLRGKCN